MQIVIDIPDEYKKQFDENRCKEKFDSLATNEFGYILRKAFENGTPLPKSHGALKDTDALMKLYGLEDATKYGNETAEQQTHSYSTMMMYEIADMLDNAPTIIEADKAESEE